MKTNLKIGVPNIINYDVDLVETTDINWSVGNIFRNSFSTSGTKTYTFSNQLAGQVLILIVKNTSGSPITLSFPTLVNNSITLTVANNKENVYTFIRSNGKTYATVVDGLA